MSQLSNEMKEQIIAYLDGQLSDRQATELKRLLSNSSELKTYYDQLKATRNLMAALPCQDCPVDMSDTVIAALERKMILDDYASVATEATGRRYLNLKKFTAVAAVILLFAGLSAVIMQVVLPESSSESDIVAFNEPVQSFNYHSKRLATAPDQEHEELFTKIVARPETLAAKFILILNTEDLLNATKMVNSSIYANTLVSDTIPKRTLTSSEYSITCSQDKVFSLLVDLQAKWDLFNKSEFVVVSSITGETLTVEKSSPQQIMEIITVRSDSSRIALARKFSAINTATDRAFVDAELAEAQPLEPRLTSSDKTSQAKIAMINLTIRINP